MKVCPSCAHQNEVGTAFCIACGHDFTTQNDKHASTEIDSSDLTTPTQEKVSVDGLRPDEQGRDSGEESIAQQPEQPSDERLNEPLEGANELGDDATHGKDPTADGSVAEVAPFVEEKTVSGSSEPDSQVELPIDEQAEGMAPQTDNCDSEESRTAEGESGHRSDDSSDAAAKLSASEDSAPDPEYDAADDLSRGELKTTKQITGAEMSQVDGRDHGVNEGAQTNERPAETLNAPISPLTNLPPAPAGSAVSPLQFSDFGEAAFGSRWWLKPTVKVQRKGRA